MNQRFFKAQDAAYESVRASLDAAFGNPRQGTVTAFQPAAIAPHDENGFAYLAAWDFYCELPQVQSILAEALASGAIQEVDAHAFQSVLPRVDV